MSPTLQRETARSIVPDSDATIDRGKPYLQVENVHKVFGKFVALRDVYLDVYPGEFVCLLGPSGCGKTTLLRIIAGLEQQTSGRVIQADKDVSRLPSSKRDFGIVFQSYALFPNLTAAQNIAYGLQNTKESKSRIKARVEELLATVGLEGLEQKYPAQMSGGQQQRVALARALALSPGLLLLDEPLSALDAQVRVRLRSEITQLQKQLGITTVMVTHDQAEALAMADRIVVMDKGCIAQIGTPHTIYQKPDTPFVANFIGVMNFLQGMVAAPKQVRCGNILLNTPQNQVEPNAGVAIAIRPEDIRVLSQEDAQNSSLPNIVTAEVEGTEFLGAGYRVALRPDGNSKELITSEISIHQARQLDLNPGASLKVQLPPELIQVFPHNF
ncbi:MAG: putative 2-aminoethylphosphonate ABC transporter ATP-binding protein [Cyanobacteria bacterium CRU_2_1]|nr:putative 2-aminoethylphosphonate ABC transporter ATP-binding protein [Cyanobacteria bacterium RU_5_0]NJR60765.1 putative 2-aminoethylphosphonate ABC transporter ATP-binding protein [Cyanobacteria bacterium CRU_2_1]